MSEQSTLEILPGLKEEHLPAVQRMLEAGISENDIPYLLGIDERFSLVQWENLSPEVRILFDEARERCLNKIENSLVRSALGGVLTTTKRGGRNDGEITIKEVGPNLAAIQYILENQRPKVWHKLKDVDENQKAAPELGEVEQQRLKRFAGQLLELANNEAQVLVTDK